MGGNLEHLHVHSSTRVASSLLASTALYFTKVVGKSYLHHSGHPAELTYRGEVRAARCVVPTHGIEDVATVHRDIKPIV